MTKSGLTAILIKYNIPFQDWGTGNAKTLDHLLKELHLGECELVETDEGLLRKVKVVVMNVFYKNGDKVYKLFEEKQVYKNGRITKREPPNSLLEKLKQEEDPFDGAKRTLFEELGITTELEIKDLGSNIERVMGKSYPGLFHEGTLFNYEVYLPETEFKKEGYQEIQEDKTNYYTWKDIS